MQRFYALSYFNQKRLGFKEKYDANDSAVKIISYAIPKRSSKIK